MIQGKTIHQLNVGDQIQKIHKVTQELVEVYGNAVGDKNPVHFDDAFAAGTVFKKRIAHGMLIAGFISEAIGMELPGPGCIYAKQDLQFVAPVYFDDTITVDIHVADVLVEKNRVILDTVCTNQNGQVVVKGTAVVLPRKEKGDAK